ncbi:ABC transporter ATP-binding protein [Ethanoligenens sp.]|uniref:ABC transporter ATP-binding protein n=1 Tax=Ethanoligenens sp. TaxID=2099655 RepID=UPI0039EB042A
MGIRLDDITLKFGDVSAVDHLSISIETGELVCLLGPSGCGKTSTFFLLAGLYTPTSGNLYFDGKRVNNVEPEEREIGMVFQNYALYPHMTVMKNILFPLNMKKVPKKIAEEQAMEIARVVQVEHLLDRKPDQLSGGQQQRVAIARALVKKPRLLLLDEPLSNLDARLRLEMREEIRRLHDETGVTTLFITHDQEEAMSISDRILVMNEGKLQQAGLPNAIYQDPANRFVASFLGNPPINFLPCIYTEENGLTLLDTAERLDCGDELPEGLAEGEAVTVGIRPENFVPGVETGLDLVCTMLTQSGRDNLLYAKAGKTPVRVLMSPDWKAKSGDHIRFAFKKGMCLFFNAKGERIVSRKKGVGADV